jgi:hypothetical protein
MLVLATLPLLVLMCELAGLCTKSHDDQLAIR